MVGTQSIIDTDEIKNLYMDKPVSAIVLTLIENLDNLDISNKSDHIVQFFSVYQKKGIRMKSDMRKMLFIGTYPLSLDNTNETDLTDMHKTQGIIQMISQF